MFMFALTKEDLFVDIFGVILDLVNEGIFKVLEIVGIQHVDNALFGAN